MKCVTCGEPTVVIDSRLRGNGSRFRRRKCVSCGAMYSTTERRLVGGALLAGDIAGVEDRGARGARVDLDEEAAVERLIVGHRARDVAELRMPFGAVLEVRVLESRLKVELRGVDEVFLRGFR